MYIYSLLAIPCWLFLCLFAFACARAMGRAHAPPPCAGAAGPPSEGPGGPQGAQHMGPQYSTVQHSRTQRNRKTHESQ